MAEEGGPASLQPKLTVRRKPVPGRRLGLPEEGTSQEQQQQQPQQDQRQPEQQPQPLSPQEEPRQNPPVAAETQDALLSPGPSSRPDDNAANRQRAHTVAVALPTLSMRVSDSIADAAPGRASEDIYSLPPPYRDAPPAYDEVDRTRPQDFEGEIQTTDDIPSNETLKSIENYIVLDRHGRTHPFRSLYTGPNVARRVLVIFIRHFFCGNCQEYMRSLSELVTPTSLLQLPVSTFIVVIGCGDPGLIEMYAKETNCQFPIYTDPKRLLFDALGMRLTLAMGTKPAYMKRPMSTSVFNSIGQALRAIPSGMTLKSGNQRQVGGEFLFEPKELLTPISTPTEEQPDPFKAKGLRELAHNNPQHDQQQEGNVEEKTVTWCHRMRTTRDHCEVPELMDILGLEPPHQESNGKQQWAAALENRKGVGTSMAQRMNEMNRRDEEPAVEDRPRNSTE
ncbi:unnamed protein product [Clonostachys chloroleuca]|uniref:Thioredoxin-like protein AAED1 n=1 Tax=Clonostachys chloroleuca TaxID=1926264 RepID=A0AA35M448_9HYPO|nr:unnamed protein product [Clonostachys chloroleuca]